MARINSTHVLPVIGLTIAIYDTLLTLPFELELVWLPLLGRGPRWIYRSYAEAGSKLSFALPRLLFIISRYSMIAVGSMFLTCKYSIIFGSIC